MTDGEAIERVKILINAAEDYFKAFGECCITEDELEAIETIFSLMKYQQTELENQDNRIKELEKAVVEKDKTTEKMIEKIIEYKDYLEGLSDECQQDCFLYHKVSDCNLFKDCKICVKEYFEKKEG